MFKRRKYVSVWTLIFPVLLLSGVGCNAPKSHLTKFNGFYEAGDLAQSRLYAQQKLGDRQTPNGEDLLWTLQLAAIERLENNYAESTLYFDRCEEFMTHFDGEHSGVGHNVGAVIVNDNIVPYTGQAYDGVMVNTYKALNFMAEKNFDLARVEFNRALDRQRRSKEKFAAEIQKTQEEVDKNANSAMVRQTMDDPALRQKLEEAYPSLYNFSAYPDFVNPFATWLAGVFFTIEGDYNKAVDLLKESAGMVPDNTYLLHDLDALEQSLNTNAAVPPTVWVVFENGLGPIKEEFRVDLPLFIATNKVRYIGIALPRLAFRSQAVPSLTVSANGWSYQTQIVADMDRIVHTEFEQDFKAILTRAIISTTAKAIAQYALEQNDSSSVAAILMAAYHFATTAADVRIWTTLPKNFQAARLPLPQDGTLSIQGGAGVPMQVKIPDCKYAVVYVKMVNGLYQPSIQTLTF
jgi:hypothetical protein